MKQYRTILTATSLGALAGLALAGGDIGSTLAYLQTIPRGFAGLPRPTNLDWIESWAGVARSLAAAPVAELLDLITHGALLGLALIVFRTLNPDFRLTAPLPAGAEPGAVLRQPIDRRRLGQIGAAAIATLWLLGYFSVWLPWWNSGLGGLLLAGPMGLERLWPHAAAASAAGLALLLGGLWLVWGEAGLLRPAAGGRRRVGRARSLAAAALAGMALAPFAMPLAGWAQTIATQVLQGMGGAARSAWLAYLGGVLVVYPLALGTAGWTAVSLARWTHFPGERRALAAGTAVAIAAWLGAAALLSLAGSGRFDDGIGLAQVAGVPAGPRGVVTTVMLLPGPLPVMGLTPAVSGQGLAATDGSARAVWAYLRWRRFRTVHLFPALMHVCQCEALDWDSDRFLKTTLLSLSYNPHPGFCQLLVEKLRHCAATPQARAALARLQDPRWFRLPPDSGRGLAVPRRRLEPAGAEVCGQLLLNGAPAEGVRVGLVEEALWQQLRGAPRALSHRVVLASGTVDASGAFRLEGIPAGRYFLLIRMPAMAGVRLPLGLRVQGSPGPITVAPGARGVEVGRVRLFVLAPPAWDGGRPARGRVLPLGYFVPPGIFILQSAQQ